MGTDFASLAGAVEQDLAAVGRQLHAEWTAELDNLRTALPGITGQAHQLIDGLAAKLIQSGEAHLAAIRAHFGLPDPETGQPTPAPAAPAVPTPAAPAPQGTDTATTSSATPSVPSSTDSASATTATPSTDTPAA